MNIVINSEFTTIVPSSARVLLITVNHGLCDTIFLWQLQRLQNARGTTSYGSLVLPVFPKHFAIKITREPRRARRGSVFCTVNYGVCAQVRSAGSVHRATARVGKIFSEKVR